MKPVIHFLIVRKHLACLVQDQPDGWSFPDAPRRSPTDSDAWAFWKVARQEPPSRCFGSGGEEIFGRAVGGSFKVSYTNRYGERRAFGTVVELCHTHVDAGSQAHRLGRWRLWQERHKLIPSIACSNIGYAQRARQGRCHTANCSVACIVAGAVVDGFELIEVNDEDRERSLIAFGAGNFLREAEAEVKLK